MLPLRVRGAGLGLALILGAVASSAATLPQDGDWVIVDKLFGKPAKDSNPDGKDASDVSGLACAPPEGSARLCLLVDDESQGAQIVILTDGRLRAGEFIRLSTAAFAGKALELDAEAVAWASGAFYVIGSHGRPRHEQGAEEQRNVARARATRNLFEIRLSADGVDMKTGRLKRPAAIRASSRLSQAILAQPGLAPSFDQALDDGGVTIEGLAASDTTLLVGFRGPVPNSSAAVLSLPLDQVFGGQVGLTGLLLPLQLGHDARGKTRGIRDLAAVAGGYVGIAGPVIDPPDDGSAIKPGDYALFWWSGTAQLVVKDLGGFPNKVKPEALLPLAFDGRLLRALLLFDGPPNGAPRQVEQDFAVPAAPAAAR